MIEIIPAIDVIEGKCVRLTKGDYDTVKIYGDDPVIMAQEFESKGIRKLHLVDLEGAKARHIINQRVLEAITTQTSLEVDFGGGVKSEDDARLAFEKGAHQINIGSMAITDPERLKSWIKTYGADRIILGADVKDENIAIHGWKETSDLSIWNFLDDFRDAGIKYVVCTDVSKDGMLEGPSFDLYQKIMQRYPDLKLVASGGITTIEDVMRLNDLKIYGAIIGKAFYEGKIDLDLLLKTLNHAD